MRNDPDHGVRACCIPDCEHLIPRTRALPVCRDCGIKIALLHMQDAELLDPVTRTRRRLAEAGREAVRKGRTPTAQVYYVRLDADRIKIGFTSNLRARLSALRVPPSALLACEPGGREVEAERHTLFRGDRINAREDFHPSVMLENWIACTREIYGLPDWATVPDTTTITRRQA